MGDRWTEMIPLNGSHSSWCVTTNSTHGNRGRGRGVGVRAPLNHLVTFHPSGPRRSAMDDDGVFSIFQLFFI